jgi:hypothetical protein
MTAGSKSFDPEMICKPLPLKFTLSAITLPLTFDQSHSS